MTSQAATSVGQRAAPPDAAPPDSAPPDSAPPLGASPGTAPSSGRRRRASVADVLRRLHATRNQRLHGVVVGVSRRLGLGPQVFYLAAFLAAVTVATLGIVFARDWFPPAALLLLMLLGGYVLRFWSVAVLAATTLAVTATLELSGAANLRPGTMIIQIIGVLAVLAFVRSRDRLGLQGALGDLMIVDLRDRLAAHGRIPRLPDGWHVDTALRAAYAEAFSGDFVVAARGEGGRLLEIALVDVSGKGQAAGVRSLLLSGAFGGLLGAMPRREFLRAANRYVLEQHWDEGFATAAHLAVRLDTGEYWMSTAGHPPAVHLHAGSGQLALVDTVGAPALGVVEGPTFSVHHGRLAHGDTLMLYTDGLVEGASDDVALGIDRLMGVLERVVAARSGDADDVLTALRAPETDDRALVLVRRD